MHLLDSLLVLLQDFNGFPVFQRTGLFHMFNLCGDLSLQEIVFFGQFLDQEVGVCLDGHGLDRRCLRLLLLRLLILTLFATFTVSSQIGLGVQI